jgi:hypothetical protein
MRFNKTYLKKCFSSEMHKYSIEKDENCRFYFCGNGASPIVEYLYCQQWGKPHCYTNAHNKFRTPILSQNRIQVFITKAMRQTVLAGLYRGAVSRMGQHFINRML